MIAAREVPFAFEGGYGGACRFAGIIELGFNDRDAFVVAAWTTPPPEPRGRYFTSIPISPANYRRKHRTDAAYHRGTKRCLCLHDDWGNRHWITAPIEIIDALVQGCVAHDLPVAA